MNERDKSLILAATSVFARYGVRKTTMNDIATEAGVARQTLYNAYPNKDAVLRAAVRLIAEETLESIEDTWRKQSDFDAKLTTFFEMGPLAWFDMVAKSPDAADLIDGLHTIAKDAMAETEQIWISRFEELLREHAKPGSVAADDTKATADFIYSSSLNAKYGVQSRTQLEMRLNILKQAVLALLD